MIDVYYWTTPNGHKITIFLEEAELPYRVVPVDLAQGKQFAPEFSLISPANKIPAIVDHAPEDGSRAVTVFESGAILLYLAQKSKKFLPTELRARVACMEWLFWQVAALGPVTAEQSYYRRASAAKAPLAIERCERETSRLYRVLDRRLSGRPFLAGDDYSIADIATYPCAAPYLQRNQNIDEMPHLERWLDRIAARPAIRRAYDLAIKVNPEAALPPPRRKPKG